MESSTKTVPTAEEAAEPIGVRRTGQAPGSSARSKSIPPEDAPVLLVSVRPGTAVGQPAPGRGHAGAGGAAEPAEPMPGDPLDETRRNVEGYQRQLQGLLDTVTRSTAVATGAWFLRHGQNRAALPAERAALQVLLLPRQVRPQVGG